MRFLCFCLLSSGLLTACSSPQPTSETPDARPAAAREQAPAASSAGPAARAIEWPTPFQPAGSRCERAATRAATIYQRPGVNTATFGQLMSGERVSLLARTADGWVGFDPATAQAANVGIFRLRWVRATEAFDSVDGCGQLPLVQAPPGGCLLMATHPVPVRNRPEAGAPVLSTIPTGSYAGARPGQATKGWMEIEVPGQTAPGYVAEADVNLSGPCR